MSVSGPVLLAEEVGGCEGVDGGGEVCDCDGLAEVGTVRRARIVERIGSVSRDSGERVGGRE